jgi:hypothetical protein
VLVPHRKKMETLEIGLENKGNAFALGPWPLFIEEVIFLPTVFGLQITWGP